MGMRYPPSIRLLTYAMLVAIVMMSGRSVSVIPVRLSKPTWITSIREQMTKDGVLSSFVVSDHVTAQVIWSDDEVFSPGQSGISVKSPPIEISREQKAKIERILSQEDEDTHFGEPCLCSFQPQMRLDWSSGGKHGTYCILISGLAGGEIRSYRNDVEKGKVSVASFVPAYLDIMDSIFPGHETCAGLRAYYNSVRSRTAANKSADLTASAGTSAAEKPRVPAEAASHL